MERAEGRRVVTLEGRGWGLGHSGLWGHRENLTLSMNVKESHGGF